MHRYLYGPQLVILYEYGNSGRSASRTTVTDDVLLLPRAGLEFLESKKMTGLT